MISIGLLGDRQQAPEYYPRKAAGCEQGYITGWTEPARSGVRDWDWVWVWAWAWAWAWVEPGPAMPRPGGDLGAGAATCR